MRSAMLRTKRTNREARFQRTVLRSKSLSIDRVQLGKPSCLNLLSLKVCKVCAAISAGAEGKSRREGIASFHRVPEHLGQDAVLIGKGGRLEATELASPQDQFLHKICLTNALWQT